MRSSERSLDGNDLSEDSLDRDDECQSAVEATDVFSPMEQGIEDSDILVQDLGLLQDHLADSTKKLEDVDPPPTPEGFVLVPRLEGTMRVSSIANRKVYWRIPLGTAGDPDWIVAEIIGGPPDPVALANGITMQLRCSARLDRKTPRYMTHKHTNQLVSLTEENYGVEWFLLQENK